MGVCVFGSVPVGDFVSQHLAGADVHDVDQLGMGPLAFLAALPLARRLGWFWRRSPGGSGNARSGATRGPGNRAAARDGTAPSVREGLPIRIFIFTPFIALLLVMVGATAIVALQTADDDATMLATKLHQAVSANIRMRLDDYLARSPPPRTPSVRALSRP